MLTKVNLSNPKVLSWAREELGLTVEGVAERFNKDPAVIAAWEHGDQAPTFRQLTELANYYKRPVAAFFLPSIPPRSPKPRDYRTLPSGAPREYSAETLLAYREVYNMVRQTRELLDELGSDIVFSLPTWSTKDPPEEKAKGLRSLLGISVEQQIKEFSSYQVALDAWRSALFDHGAIVRVCEMPIADVRAFCLFAGNLAGIGLSNEDREHGRIFSLFHEVCHLSLQRPGVSGLATNHRSANQTLEQYCDRFSASFLLPSSHPEVLDSIRLFAGSIDFLELGQFVANKFKVSKYVALRRALDLDVVSPGVYWQVIAEWKKLDQEYVAKQREKERKRREAGKAGGDYYATQVSHIGKRFIGLVLEAVQKNELTPVEGRRILGVDPAAIEPALW